MSERCMIRALQPMKDQVLQAKSSLPETPVKVSQRYFGAGSPLNLLDDRTSGARLECVGIDVGNCPGDHCDDNKCNDTYRRNDPPPIEKPQYCSFCVWLVTNLPLHDPGFPGSRSPGFHSPCPDRSEVESVAFHGRVLPARRIRRNISGLHHRSVESIVGILYRKIFAFESVDARHYAIPLMHGSLKNRIFQDPNRLRHL